MQEQETAEADLREEAEHVDTKPKGEEAEQESFQEEPSPKAPAVIPDDVVSIGSSVYHDAEDDLQVPNPAQHTSKKVPASAPCMLQSLQHHGIMMADNQPK